MQRLKGRSIVLVALAALACSGDPTNNEGTPTVIAANPDVVFVTQGDSQAILVSVVDEEGKALEAVPTATNIGSGITVSLDPTFQELNTPTPTGKQSRFFVKGVDLTATTFTFEALGLTKTIQVTSVPGQLNATISDTVPALGAPVTLTLPPGVFITDSSVLTITGLPQIIVSQDAAAGVITFIPAPNSNNPAVLSNVGVTSNPNIVFDLATPAFIHTDSVTVFPSTISTLAPSGAAAVTLTSTDPLFTLGPTSQVAIGVDSALTETATGSAMTFLPFPGSKGVITVKDVFVVGYPLSLPSTTIDTVTVGTASPSPIPGTGSVATAPTITLVPGTARGVLDAVTAGDPGCPPFGVDCQDYKFVVPQDDSVFVTGNFEGDSDMGFYFFAADGVTAAGNTNCDLQGGGLGTNQEACAFDLAAGTYVLRVQPFGPTIPQWVNVRLSIH